MKEVALIKCCRDGEHAVLDIKGEIGNILTTVGIALYQIETSLPEDEKADFRSKVLAALEASRKKFKGEKINENS